MPFQFSVGGDIAKFFVWLTSLQPGNSLIVTRKENGDLEVSDYLPLPEYEETGGLEDSDESSENNSDNDSEDNQEEQDHLTDLPDSRNNGRNVEIIELSSDEEEIDHEYSQKESYMP